MQLPSSSPSTSILPLPAAEEIQGRWASLTPRQREVCQQMVEGALNKQIAWQLGMSINTVKTHRKEVLQRMQAQSLVHLGRMIQVLAQPPADADSAQDDPALDVVVVEDDPLVRELFEIQLLGLGHRVRGVAHGGEVKRVFAERAPQIVLLDLCLGPGREDGLAVVQRLRREHRCGIIMMTAQGNPSARIRSYEGGADGFLAKPIDFNELDAMMLSVWRRIKPSPIAELC